MFDCCSLSLMAAEFFIHFYWFFFLSFDDSKIKSKTNIQTKIPLILCEWWIIYRSNDGYDKKKIKKIWKNVNSLRIRIRLKINQYHSHFFRMSWFFTIFFLEKHKRKWWTKQNRRKEKTLILTFICLLLVWYIDFILLNYMDFFSLSLQFLTILF